MEDNFHNKNDPIVSFPSIDEIQNLISTKFKGYKKMENESTKIITYLKSISSPELKFENTLYAILDKFLDEKSKDSYLKDTTHDEKEKLLNLYTYLNNYYISKQSFQSTKKVNVDILKQNSDHIKNFLVNSCLPINLHANYFINVEKIHNSSSFLRKNMDYISKDMLLLNYYSTKYYFKYGVHFMISPICKENKYEIDMIQNERNCKNADGELPFYLCRFYDVESKIII